MAQRDLVVRFVGDDRDLQRAFTTSERRATVFQSRMTRLNQSLRGGLMGAGGGTSLLFGSGAFIGTAAITKGISEAIEASSDLNEQMARSRQVFDESADSIEDWSKGLASSFGIAQSQALEFAGTFGLLFRNLGSSAPAAEDFSKQLVQLAADLASFNNTDVETALAALRSGLTGEIEPLRKFGVFLSEARTQTEALAKTGKRTAAELTNQEKVIARLGIILADTSRAQGDFARTSDGLANKQRIAAAEAQNLSAAVGKALAPAMDIALISTIALVGGLNDLITGMGDLRVALRESDMFASFNQAIEDANAKATGFFEGLRDNIPLLNEVARLRGAVVGGGTSFAVPDRPEEGRGALDAAAGRAKQIEKDTLKAKLAQERMRKAFDEFVKGLGLKLDRAGLTADLNDDLAVMREIERAIQKRISAEGRTFKLASALTDIQLRIASTIASQQQDAEQRETDALEKRIEAQQKADDRRRELLRQRQERRQGQQFEALGLTAEGDTRVPGSAALRRRLGNIRKAVEGTVLDTKSTETQLDRISRVLAGRFGKVGKEVRAAILQMFNDIAQALDQGQKQGPLTKSSGLNTKKILEGLGLSEEEINALRGRLSSINSAGRQLAIVGARAPGSTGRDPSDGGGRSTSTVIVENRLWIDGVEAQITRQQQKTRRRNPQQKRGPNRHR